MTGVRKLSICGLSPDINNSLVVGVIIAKQKLKTFVSRKDGEERGVWNFTLRDSPTDTINATYWGSADGAKGSYETYRIGDVVEVMNARILFKQQGSCDTIFNPAVSSPFQLQLQENSSILLRHDEEDSVGIRSLMHVPAKPPWDFLRLYDVLSYGQAMKGDYINLLVAIRKVSDVRTVQSKKDSSNFSCRDIFVMDQSHMDFQMTLWSDEVIHRAEQWRPHQTVLFFADVRLDWSDFKQSVTAVITSRTIITENPDTAEGNDLRKYAATFPLKPIAILDHLSQSVTDTSTINLAMTTAQIIEKAWNNNSLSSDHKFMALLFAVITSLDLDGSDCPVTYKCSVCLQFLDQSRKCLNTECFLASKNQFATPTPVYDIKVQLTDHRGSLFNCRLMSPSAEEILNCTVDNYLKMAPPARTQLKWQLLLTRCEVRMLILCASPERPYPLYSILTCKPVNPSDVASKLPIY